MKIHELKRKNKNKKHRTLGRGGKHAKTAGRGTKGQNARSGRKKRPEMRDIIKKLPKRRGRGVNIFQSYEIKPATVKLESISKVFKDGEKVTPATLVEKKLVSTRRGKAPHIKILGNGAIDKKVAVSGVKVSESAKAAIIAAGGSVE